MASKFRKLISEEKEQTELAVKRMQVQKEKTDYEVQGLRLERKILPARFQTRSVEIEMLIQDKEDMLKLVNNNLKRLREHLTKGVRIKDKTPSDE